jgi:predicted outer membrane protein
VLSVSRKFATLLAISAVAACSTNQSYMSAGDVNLSAYPSAQLDQREMGILRGMSDANIMAHIRLVDSMEVAAADSALRFTKSDDVREYAKLMHLQHTTDLTHVRLLAQQTGITPTIDVSGLRASHIAAQMDSVRLGSDVHTDRHYLLSQIDLHTHVLAELEALQGTARNSDVRQQVTAMIPVVRDHLARAHALAVTLGYESKRG